MSTFTDALEQLLEENARLRKEVSQLHSENAQLKTDISFLNERVNWFTRQIFGKRSEKSVEPKETEEYLPGFGEMFSNPPEQKTRRVAAHTRRTPFRCGQNAITLPSNVPVERRVIDLSEKEKVCPETGKPLVKIGEEVTQKGESL
jgi:transposase